MNRPAVIPSRKLLQAAEAVTFDHGATVFMIQNVSTTAVAAPSNTSTSLDSSMTLIILIVVTAVVFTGIFSVYILCFSERSDNSSPSSSTTNTAAATSSSESSHSNRPYPSDQKIGLDPSTVKSLPLLPYDKAATPPLLDDCPICLSEFRDTECVKMIPYCGHVFHPLCLDMWLESNMSCPLCRSTRLLMVAEEV